MTPISINQFTPLELKIEWDDGHISTYPTRELRLACRCASCISEVTGQKILNDSMVPLDVRPVHVEPVGRYAVAIVFSDGHKTGIYTFDNLRKICPCCKK
ncbi:DUF971 domain-containing protein [bacterium]|nr:DUF971 domain-containing protein [bacterium]